MFIHRFKVVIVPFVALTQVTLVSFSMARNEQQEKTTTAFKEEQQISSSSSSKKREGNHNTTGKITGSDSCRVPSCSSKMDMFQKSLLVHQKSDQKTINSNNNNNKPTQPTRSSSSSQIITKSSNELDTALSSHEDIECPLDKEDLGRASWSVIHTVAAHIPENPTNNEQKHMTQFIESFAALYPCHVCAPEFQQYVRNYPPLTSSRAEFVLWCCRLHNHINEHLGKDVIKCDLNSLDERWKDGHRSCWPDNSHHNNNYSGNE